MVELNSNAQTILLKLIDQYCDFHKQGEYGTSSFWNWYYQVKNYIYQLDRQSRPIGIGLNYTMQTWGDIYFSRVIVGGEVFVVVTDFEFNTTNFGNNILVNVNCFVIAKKKLPLLRELNLLDAQGSIPHARCRADGSQGCRKNRYYQLNNGFPKVFVLHLL